jgi:hypothetical protein
MEDGAGLVTCISFFQIVKNGGCYRRERVTFKQCPAAISAKSFL